MVHADQRDDYSLRGDSLFGLARGGCGELVRQDALFLDSEMLHADQHDVFTLRDDARCGYAHDGGELVR